MVLPTFVGFFSSQVICIFALMETEYELLRNFHSPLSTQRPRSTHRFPVHLHLDCQTHFGCQYALQTLQAAEVLCSLFGTLTARKLSLRSSAVGSGGGFLLRSTIFAVILVLLADAPPMTVTRIFTVCSVFGVCHLHQTSCEAPFGYTIFPTVYTLFLI